MSVHQAGPTHLLGLPRGADLVGAITAYVRDHGVHTAWLSYLGAVSRAALRYYDQEAQEYRDFVIDEHLEVLSGTGNISLKDGDPFVHTHAAFGDAAGRAFGGHVHHGTTVFALEVRIDEMLGEPLVRRLDPVTGLALWHGGAG